MQCIELTRLPDGTLFSKEDQPKVDKWIAALRSGKFKQGTEMLYSGYDGTMCCMGVLEHVVNNVELITMEGLGYPKDIPCHEAVMLRGKLAQHLQITVKNLEEGHEHTETPDALNDELILSFDEIADLLEGKPVYAEPPWNC